MLIAIAVIVMLIGIIIFGLDYLKVVHHCASLEETVATKDDDTLELKRIIVENA